MMAQPKFAVVFPGQGSQAVGMLQALSEKVTLVKALYAQASDVLDYDLWKLVCEGPDEKLNQTIYTQPAMLVADVAMWHIWREQHAEMPAFLAGHSLGEYAALVAAEAIDFTDAVSLVSVRAHRMQEAVAPGEGAMAVVLGLEASEVQALCQQVEGVVEPVNFNAPGQIVLAGETEAVEAACVEAKAHGARRAMKLPISIPSHCVLMQPVSLEFAKYLSNVAVGTPKIPVINNVDVAMPADAHAIRDALVRQLYRPVRWIETIQYMANAGVAQIIECGPGKVLTGLGKRIAQNIEHTPLSAVL